MLTYDWRIDLALILGVANGVYAILDRKGKRRKDKLTAYEMVYDDACFVLEHPFRKKRQAARSLQYTNEDKDFERAVRLYVDAHELNLLYGRKRYIPDHITDPKERHQYLKRVSEEARVFKDRVFEEEFALAQPDLSPVMYLDDVEIATRIDRIITNVGRHLSQFDGVVRHLWERAKSADPEDIKSEYRRSLDVCAHYFEHNPRGFDDPFVDLPAALRLEYRALSLTARQRWQARFDWSTRWMPFWLRYPRLSTRRWFRRASRLRY